MDFSKPRTHVVFETDLAKGEEDAQLPGKNLLNYLSGELINRGFKIGCGFDCRYSHDFECTVGSKVFHVMMGPVHGDLGLWLLQVESKVGWLPHLLKVNDTKELNDLVVEIDRILKRSHDIAKVKWYKSADHYREFGETDWTAAP